MAADLHSDTGVVREILSYFVRNPMAAEDLEGIARWRLMEEIARRKVEETRQALKQLVEAGYLRETLVAGSAPIFSLNFDRLEEAKAFLAADDPAAGGKKK